MRIGSSLLSSLTTNRRFKRYKVLVIAFFFALFLYYSGLYMYLLEEDYYRHFTYPLAVDVSEAVAKLKRNRKPELTPINVFNYSFLISSSHKCRNELAIEEPIKLLYVIKSALDHFDNRKAIRETWGWESRFSDVLIRRVFLLGIPSEVDPILQLRIHQEQDKNKDLVQAAFVDTYYNNTIKTLMGLHWTVLMCSKAEYVMFVDDDYYVSTKNVLRFLRRPDSYPEYLQRALLSVTENNRVGDQDEDEERNTDLMSPPSHFFAGYKFPNSKPHRIKTSKWFIALKEYPFSRFPPYVTAGAYIMSMPTVQTLYYTSYFTLPFRFDDIYLGILAKKANIEPIHNSNFFFNKPHYSRTAYKYYIASHGYDDPQELVNVWNEQRMLGNA